MNRDRPAARWLAGAVLGVVALGLAAATLNSAVSEPRGGSAGPPGEDSGWFLLPEPTPTPVESFDVPLLAELVQLLVLLALLAAVAWALLNRREALVNLVFVLVAIGVGYLLVLLMLRLSGGGGEGGLPLGRSGGGPFGDGTAATGATQLDLPVGALVAVLGLALAVAVAAVLRSAGSGPDEPPGAADGRAAAVGRAAGRAADRIRDGTTADNEVYRAWREMTDLLDVPNPASSTPGEFAAAAVEAGMAGEDVEELTALFEAVRYGGAEPSAGLERRAVAAFERIEATYAEGG